ncbi:hypothetical protein HDV05_002869 [Chytridiales sp. JEL 0842]|nr:hypothetical protein HDV05_002869 [Chytridiales sp. JEL 0842]
MLPLLLIALILLASAAALLYLSIKNLLPRIIQLQIQHAPIDKLIVIDELDVDTFTETGLEAKIILRVLETEIPFQIPDWAAVKVQVPKVYISRYFPKSLADHKEVGSLLIGDDESTSIGWRDVLKGIVDGAVKLPEPFDPDNDKDDKNGKNGDTNNPPFARLTLPSPILVPTEPDKPICISQPNLSLSFTHLPTLKSLVRQVALKHSIEGVWIKVQLVGLEVSVGGYKLVEGLGAWKVINLEKAKELNEKALDAFMKKREADIEKMKEDYRNGAVKSDDKENKKDGFPGSFPSNGVVENAQDPVAEFSESVEREQDELLTSDGSVDVRCAETLPTSTFLSTSSPSDEVEASSETLRSSTFLSTTSSAAPSTSSDEIKSSFSMSPSIPPPSTTPSESTTPTSDSSTKPTTEKVYPPHAKLSRLPPRPMPPLPPFRLPGPPGLFPSPKVETGSEKPSPLTLPLLLSFSAPYPSISLPPLTILFPLHMNSHPLANLTVNSPTFHFLTRSHEVNIHIKPLIVSNPIKGLVSSTRGFLRGALRGTMSGVLGGEWGSGATIVSVPTREVKVECGGERIFWVEEILGVLEVEKDLDAVRKLGAAVKRGVGGLRGGVEGVVEGFVAGLTEGCVVM